MVYNKYSKGNLLRPAFTEIFHTDYKKILPKLPEIIPALFPEQKKEEVKFEEGKDTDEEFKNCLLKGILELWNKAKSGPWRDCIEFIKIIPGIDENFPKEEFSNFFLEELMDIVKTGNQETKSFACKAICELLLKNYFAYKRKAIFQSVVQLSAGVSSFDRYSFLGFCNTALDYFSVRHLSEYHIFTKCISLATDKITKVKLKFISISIKLWLASIEAIKEEIVETLNNLRNDKKKEVRYAAEKVYYYIEEHLQELKNESKKFLEDDPMKYLREQDLFQRELYVSFVHNVNRN